MSATVGVVLVNWNGAEFTLACLRSLYQGSIVPNVIVVVDNGSCDNSVDRIAEAFPAVEIVRNSSNEGFARANNIGVAKLLHQGMDYVWILNNDTTVEADSLAFLLRTVVAHPEAACVTGKILHAAAAGAIWYGGGVRDRVTRAPRHILDDRLARDGGGQSVPVDFVSGCNMLVPRGILETVGGFRSSYVAYSEDSEWCWRVRKLGYNMYYAPTSVIRHAVSGSVKQNTGRAQDAGITSRAYYLMVRNHFWTLRLHVTGSAELLFCLVMYLVVSARIMLHCLTSRQPWKIGAIMRGVLSGLFNAIPMDCSFSV